VNKIGLRNPGIYWLQDKVDDGKIDVSDKIVSVHGFDDNEWVELFRIINEIEPMFVEVNVSCPNVKDDEDPLDVLDLLHYLTVPVIVKLPPVDYMGLVEKALAVGVTHFHCCNTIPVKQGGMSGKPLKPKSLAAVGIVREMAMNENVLATIIGGGGVTSMRDVDDYFNEGANHVSIASCNFFPWNILKFARISKKLVNAKQS